MFASHTLSIAIARMYTARLSQRLLIIRSLKRFGGRTLLSLLDCIALRFVALIAQLQPDGVRFLMVWPLFVQNDILMVQLEWSKALNGLRQCVAQ